MEITNVPHLGPSGINSPGYGPRAETPEYREAEEWTKNYWEKLFKGRTTDSEGVNTRASNG